MTKAYEKALEVANPTEVQQERFALLVCFGDEGSDGQGLTVSEAGRRLGLSAAVARNWWRTKFVQDTVRELLGTLRNEAKLNAAKHQDAAIKTLVKALDSPAYTTPQINAAKALLSFGFGEKEAAETNVGIVVNVGTGIPDEALAQQQRRHLKGEQRAIDGDFTVTPVE
jgi:uncharacterized protein (DUF1778 family)